MPHLSPLRASVPILQGLPDPHRGKVRDTYDLGNGLLLVVCSDGISIFDFVLNCLIPQKGMILTAMTHFWLAYHEMFGFRTHFIAAGAVIDEYLPQNLRRDPALQSRSMVVRKLTMNNREFIARVAITGSVMDEYLKTGMVYGHNLLADLQDGDLLPYILDTPTTKAKVGHDEPLLAEQVRAEHPEETYLLLKSIQLMSNYARGKGIFIADTKEEYGRDQRGRITLADEVGSPDSTRFWDLAEWEKSRTASKRKPPAPFDKQLVRLWGKEYGINDMEKFNPENPNDVARVHELIVPSGLVNETTQTYRHIFLRLVGMTVEDYFKEKLRVLLPKINTDVSNLF